MSILDVGAAFHKPDIASCNDPPGCMDALLSKTAAKPADKGISDLLTLLQQKVPMPPPMTRQIALPREVA
jgi:hypothetical protein